MKYRVRLRPRPKRTWTESSAGFTSDGPTVAGGRWFSRLMAKIDTLETHPERCAIADESEDLGVEIRELLFGKRHGVYRILFQIEGRTVQILRVWHGARIASRPRTCRNTVKKTLCPS